MKLESPIWVPPGVISDDEGCHWNKTQENDSRNNTVRDNHRLVPSHVLESISHAYPDPCQLSLSWHYYICMSDAPLYRIVSKFTPMRLGSKNVSRSLSHVPSPTCSVFEEYVLLPGAASPETVISLDRVYLSLECSNLLTEIY